MEEATHTSTEETAEVQKVKTTVTETVASRGWGRGRVDYKGTQGDWGATEILSILTVVIT